MNPPRRAFTLVETALAIAITSIAIAALLGTLPAGLATNATAQSQTRAALVLANVIAECRAAGSLGDLATFGGGSGTGVTIRFLDEFGSAEERPSPTSEFRLRAAAVEHPKGDAAGALVHLRLTWPAAADPAAADGMAETFVAISRD